MKIQYIYNFVQADNLKSQVCKPNLIKQQCGKPFCVGVRLCRPVLSHTVKNLSSDDISLFKFLYVYIFKQQTTFSVFI